MTAAVIEAMTALSAALTGVRGVRHYTDISATVAPPGTVLGPPELSDWGFDGVPHRALIKVALVVTKDERAVTRLLELLPAVTAAIDSVPSAAVTTALPGVWPVGELPAYLIETEVSL